MRKLTLGAAALAAILGGGAIAQTTHPLVSSLNAGDYFPIQQSTGSGNQWTLLSSIATFVRAVSGTLTATTVTATAVNATTFNGNTFPVSGGTALTTAATVSATTGLTLTPLRPVEMRTAAGLYMAATASSTNFGLTYTPGTTEVLVGTATSSSTTGNTAAIDVILPPWYKAASDITLKVGCYYTEGSGSTTAHTMAAAAYLNTIAGAQGTTLIATAAQVCPITTSALQTFTITGATLLPGSHLTLTFTAAVANATGVGTEWLTSASIN